MKFDKAKIRYPADKDTLTKENKSRPSVFTEGHRGEYYNIDVNKLIPFHKQPRKHFDENALQEMSESIKRHGIRQPLTIIADKSDVNKYQVVSGERRLRAAKLANLTHVPCIIIHDYKNAAEIAIIENIQREDLHPLELARAYEQLLEEGICNSHADIASKIGSSKSVVTETIGLLKLPDEIKNILLSKNINKRRFFRELAKSKNKSQMISLLETYCEDEHNKDLSKTEKITQKRRKILLKVVLDAGRVCIDTNHISKMSENQKQEAIQQIQKALV